ncbi:MAG: acyltransferase family protein [Eubacteriales bacterium]
MMALAIMLCHIRNKTLLLNDTAFGALMTALAYLIVGLFFFFTGYGLRESVVNKPGYKNKFMRNRIIPYYVDCIIFIFIYTVYRCITGAEVTIVGIIKSSTFFDSYVINGWYLQVALLVYLAFWIAWKFDKKYECLILCLFLVAYIVICIVIDAPITRTQSILGLPLGFLWSWKKRPIEAALKKHGWLFLLSSFILTILTIILGGWYTTGLMQLAIKSISTIFFIVFCLCAFRYIPIQCKITEFLGKISLEVYVIHGMFIDIFGRNIDTWGKTVLFLSEVLACSIIAAWILHLGLQKINNRIRRLFLKEDKQ